MKRRSFIKTGLVTLAAGATSNSALSEIVVPIGTDVSQSEMTNFLREMDNSMDRILHAGGDYIKSLINQTPSETEQNFFRSSLRSLLLVGNFGSLSIKGQVHPWMQKRLLYSAPEVNYSVTTSLDILKNMSEESKEDIMFALKDDPEMGDRILEVLDLEAKTVGVPKGRRRQMRVMGKRIIRRLRHSPDMFIEEHVRKADKLLAACDSEKDLEHLLRLQMGEQNYSKSKNDAEKAAIQWSDMEVHDMPVGYNPILTETSVGKPSKKKINPEKKGLRLLGIGGIMTAVGWLFIAIAGGTIEGGVGLLGAILGITVGPILILIALLIIIISSIANASKKQKQSGL
ncbi:hypothetical protein E9993_01445 [Labilibacter sediminis]|nr:hypothetical protein E9993_01445 [Labilibacter sediminis]